MKRITLLALLLIYLALVGCNTISPKLQNEYIRDKDSIGLKAVINDSRQAIQQFMLDEKVQGASVSLVDCDGILWSAGFGYTDKKQKTPVTAETIFAIMSITKVFTKTAVMFAVQDGLVELDVPITKYLPDFTVNSRFEENPQEKITLRHLLTHTSGLAYDTTVGNGGEMENVSFEDHIQSICHTWLRHKVGEKRLYSNIGMDLAAYILQVRSGKPYSEYLSETVFKPLNMTHSTTELEQVRQNANRAIGQQQHVKKVSLDVINFYLGAGSVVTSAEDLAKFIQFHLNHGKVKQKQILDERFIDMMYEPSPLLYPQRGAQRNILPILPNKSEDANRKFGHDGGGLGYCSYMCWYPEYGVGALIMVNSALGKNNGAKRWMNSTTQRLIDEKLVKQKEFFDAIAWQENWPINANGLDPNSFTTYEPDWKKYTGTYRIRWDGYQPYAYAKILLAIMGYPEFEAKVYEKDGYLEILYQGLPWRLDEYKRGLFFTTEGECLDLRSEIPTWQNYRMKKIR